MRDDAQADALTHVAAGRGGLCLLFKVRYSSRWTVAGEKAGRQTARYSAPSGPGVL